MEKVNQKQWDAAIAALKPTKRDLDYGLKLHAESIVCEPYGFTPSAEIVPAKDVQKMLDNNASVWEIAKYIQEMRPISCILEQKLWDQYKRALHQTGITCIFQNAGEETQDPLCIIERLARFTLITDMKEDFVFKAITPNDIIKAKKENRHCLYFASNGVPLMQRWESAEEELHLLKLFFMMGIRMMHLTYNRRNMLGDGCAELANGGLSDFGAMAVREMNRVGIIVDVAHSGWQTSLEAVKASSKPVVASHSVCHALNPNYYRSKNDEIIKAIADSGGFIGICSLQTFIAGRGGIQDFLNHIDYVGKKFGPDYVAIATDRGYSCVLEDKDKENFPRIPRNRPIWEKLYREKEFPTKTIEIFKTTEPELAWTNWPLYTVGLVQRGYSDKEIKKILGENVLRVANEVIKDSAYLPKTK